MVAPAANQLAGDFGVTNTAVIAMMTSVFVLGYGQLFLLLTVRNTTQKSF
jgi:hypothetical protein